MLHWIYLAHKRDETKGYLKMLNYDDKIGYNSCRKGC